MKSDILKELEWRGLIQDYIDGIDDLFNSKSVKAYIGFDPTSDSLHIGSLVPIIILKHLLRHGHQPYALIGGATGMVGDPSGKSKERNLLDNEQLQNNINGVTNQLCKLINNIEIVNNYDWFKDFSFLDFIRDVGKHFTVNYMMSKDSVKSRIDNESGISFTEFSYQLIQGYDFFHLYKELGVEVQMGGSDQWGNITTGTEMIRRILGGDNKGYALTSPLIKKSDGGKFGKSEDGNIWLDVNKTSPYNFFQFWKNVNDVDAENWIKIFCFLSKEDTYSLIEAHKLEPHKRILQNHMAEEITTWIHGEEEMLKAKELSELLFNDFSRDKMIEIGLDTLKTLFDDKSIININLDINTNTKMSIIDFLYDSKIMPSKSEIRRSLVANSFSINQEKVNIDKIIDINDFNNDNYLLVRFGKRKYTLVING